MSLRTCESILQQLIPPVRRACLLVPELTLSILSSSNPLWHIPYEEAMTKLDRSDPWWAFLWPGSQALSRYLLDNQAWVHNRCILDIGCGCGASSIAAKLGRARYVIANDIDSGKLRLSIEHIYKFLDKMGNLLDALIATKHNATLNNVKIDLFSSVNFLGDAQKLIGIKMIDCVVIGDMCYDEQLAHAIVKLVNLASQLNIKVLLADPGRSAFKKITVKQLSSKMKQVSEYPILDRDYMEADFKTIQVWMA